MAITGPGGGAEIDAELARDDLRQRGLAEPGRADEQHVVERLLARARRLDEHREVGARLLLADELGEPLRAQRGFRGVVLAALGGDEAAGRGAHELKFPRSRLYLFGSSSPIDATTRAVCARHDHARVAVVVPDQLAAGAARRHHRDGPILLVGRRMAHRDDRVDAGFAGVGDRLAERNRLGADRHAAEIGVETDAGEDLAGARAQRRADLLPVVAIAPPDRVGRGLDQCAVRALSIDAALSLRQLLQPEPDQLRASRRPRPRCGSPRRWRRRPAAGHSRD